MKIKIKENNKNIEEYNLLYNSVGWGAYDEKISKKALLILYIQLVFMMKIKLLDTED